MVYQTCLFFNMGNLYTPHLKAGQFGVGQVPMQDVETYEEMFSRMEGMSFTSNKVQI